jgi:hypothetical protein
MRPSQPFFHHLDTSRWTVSILVMKPVFMQVPPLLCYFMSFRSKCLPSDLQSHICCHCIGDHQERSALGQTDWSLAVWGEKRSTVVMMVRREVAVLHSIVAQ